MVSAAMSLRPSTGCGRAIQSETTDPGGFDRERQDFTLMLLLHTPSQPVQGVGGISRRLAVFKPALLNLGNGFQLPLPARCGLQGAWWFVKQRQRRPQRHGAVQQPELRARCGQLRKPSEQFVCSLGSPPSRSWRPASHSKCVPGSSSGGHSDGSEPLAKRTEGWCRGSSRAK